MLITTIRSQTQHLQISAVKHKCSCCAVNHVAGTGLGRADSSMALALQALRPARLLEAAAGAYQAEDGYLFMSIVIVFIMSSNVKQLTIFEDQPKTVKK